MTQFHFKLLQRDKKTNARLGQIHTPHGIIETPSFTPVGTQATVKSLTPDEIGATGTELFFVNTYHTYLRPGMDVIKKFGGLHTFMGWNSPLITDSGGFQVFSLGAKKEISDKRKVISKKDISIDQSDQRAKLAKIDEDGVTFQSHWDGTSHRFTPEKSIEFQHTLGADIILCFDDCTPYGVTESVARKSMDRTHRWAVRSLDYHRENPRSDYGQALYGIVQGSVFETLRQESAEYISSLPFDGLAIGGVSVGESKKEMVKVLQWVTPLLPGDKPRHLLGVGEIDDVFAAVEYGMDTFDCVQPTRLARMGRLLVQTSTPIKSGSKLKVESKEQDKRFTLDITKKIYTQDTDPIDSTCDCYTCTRFSRAYIHHLFHVRELLAYRLATIHNVRFMHRLLLQIRESIVNGSFLELKKKWLAR